MNKNNNLQERLKSKGYKLTGPRKTILDLLEKNRGKSLSAQELFELLGHKGIDFSTIYRNLELMAREDIISAIHREDGTQSYELCGEDHHHHLICMDCGSTRCIDFCPMDLIKKVNWEGFTPVKHRFEIMGLCAKCEQKKR